MTTESGEIDLAPVAVEALETSLENVGRPLEEAKESGLFKLNSVKLSDELERLADDLRAESQQPETERRVAASRSAFGLFQLDMGWLMKTTSEGAWDLLDALVVTAYSTDEQSSRIYASGQAAGYARATFELLTFPHGRGAATDRSYITWDEFTERLRDSETRRAAVGICCRRGLADECVDELGECLQDDDALVRRLAAVAVRHFEDYTFDFDTDEGAPMKRFDPTPIVDELVAATADDDQRVSEAAVDALQQLESRSDEIDLDEL